MDEVINEFLIESSENLDMLDRAMVELENDPRHKTSLDSVFRTIHTVKGSCGFLGYASLEKLTHTGENLLSLIRDDRLALNAERTSALLAMVDAIRRTLVIVEATGAEGSESYDGIVATLAALSEAGADSASTPTAAAPPAKRRRTKRSAATGAAASAPLSPGSGLAAAMSIPPPAGIKGGESQDIPAVAPARQALASDATIRVDVNLLDKLMNLVGELVLARNQILQFSDARADKSLLNACQRLNLITTEIQENFLKTRMQPIDNIFGRFPRIVRDLAAELGKSIRLDMAGSETELDRTIIEAIKDPLTHIVRNSLDHGIETPERRLASGKSPEGRLELRAWHEGGQVNIEIRDDGAGLNAEKLKQKALDKGLLSLEEIAALGEREAFNLIFLPGFSTAEKITNVSGRGVGMDVVRTNIGKIGGSVEIQSESGRGTTLKIRIPLTLAIIPALLVNAAGERFALPQVSLVELLRLEGPAEQRRIELIHGAPVYRLRGKLLPLVYLERVLELGRAAHGRPVAEVTNILVLQAEGRQFGLVVDGISDTEEIVVKPLGRHLKEIDCFAGATIMGDGRVALILDVLALAQKAKVLREGMEALCTAETQEVAQSEPGAPLLLLDGAAGAQLAIPLSMVARLERFRRSEVELASRRAVVQYRGRILPLIRLDEILEGCPRDHDSLRDSMHVVVYSNHGRSIGLIVDHIRDIVDDHYEIECPAERPGFLGSAIVRQRVTDFLDLPNIIRSAAPEYLQGEPAQLPL